MANFRALLHSGILVFVFFSSFLCNVQNGIKFTNHLVLCTRLPKLFNILLVINICNGKKILCTHEKITVFTVVKNVSIFLQVYLD